jgi:hypothetical protein
VNGHNNTSTMNGLDIIEIAFFLVSL